MKKRIILAILFVLFSCAYVSAMPLAIESGITLGASLPNTRKALDNTPKMGTIRSSTFTPLKGMLGEKLTNGYLNRNIGGSKASQWWIVNPRQGSQGLDHFALKFGSDDVLDDVLIAESKFTKKGLEDALKTTNHGTIRQMSMDWVKPRVQRAIIDKFDEFISADEIGDVKIVRSLPNGKIPDDIYPIGNNSFYFKNEDGDLCFFSSNENRNYLDDVDERIGRGKATVNSIRNHIDRTDVRRELFHYELLSDGSVERTVYRIRDGETGSNSVSYTREQPTRISKEETHSLVSSDDFRNAMMESYGLEDGSFFKDPNFTDEDALSLVEGIDKKKADIIFSDKYKANSYALSKKLGLNPNVDYKKVGLSDADWNNISKSELTDLPDELQGKLKKASAKATILGGVGASIAGGLLGGVSAYLADGFSNGFDNISWAKVAYSGVMGASISALNTVAEALQRKIISKATQEFTKTLSATSKFTKALFENFDVLPFFVDAFVDIGYGLYSMFNGTYAYKSQALADIGLNVGVDLSIAVLSGAIGSVCGPLGTAVGIVLGSIWAFGSYYIINPITSKIEQHNIFKELESPNSNKTVQEWTKDELARNLIF